MKRRGRATARVVHSTTLDYDGLMFGAGHNTLVLHVYLCRAGFKVSGGGGQTN